MLFGMRFIPPCTLNIACIIGAYHSLPSYEIQPELHCFCIQRKLEVALFHYAQPHGTHFLLCGRGLSLMSLCFGTNKGFAQNKHVYCCLRSIGLFDPYMGNATSLYLFFFCCREKSSTKDPSQTLLVSVLDVN